MNETLKVITGIFIDVENKMRRFILFFCLYYIVSSCSERDNEKVTLLHSDRYDIVSITDKHSGVLRRKEYYEITKPECKVKVRSIIYYDNGGICKDIFYKNGLKDSIMREYFANGKMKRKQFYYKDSILGTVTKYDSLGGQISSFTFYFPGDDSESTISIANHVSNKEMKYGLLIPSGAYDNIIKSKIDTPFMYYAFPCPEHFKVYVNSALYFKNCKFKFTDDKFDVIKAAELGYIAIPDVLRFGLTKAIITYALLDSTRKDTIAKDNITIRFERQ